MTGKQEVGTGGIETRPQKPERPGKGFFFFNPLLFRLVSLLWSHATYFARISRAERTLLLKRHFYTFFFPSLQPVFLTRRLNSLTNARIIFWRQACGFTSTNIRWAASITTTISHRNKQEEERLERERERRRPGVCGSFGFNFRSLVQAFPSDGLHGQWTEIHPQSGKKLVLLCSLHTSHTAQVQALFYLMLIKC